MRKDILEGSPALKIQAEKLMIEAAEQARREKRDPSRMLRVMALLASPVYDPQNPDISPVHLDLQAEWHRLAEGVRQSGAPILLARLGPPTLPALRAALSPRAAEQSAFPHVLHFSGHAWEEGMVLEDDLGQVHRAGTAQVLAALKGMPQKLDLVVLNGCESAASARSVAQALLDGGLARAVVGHERSVLDSEAVAFAARLYAELCGGFPLQDALDNARKEITTHEVILLGEEKLRFEGLSGAEPWIDERRQKGSLLPQARLFLGRGRELVRMAGAMAKPPAAMIISGPPGMGKSSLLLEAALRSGWRFPGGVAYAAGPRAEEARAANAEGLLASLAGELGLERAEDLFPYTSMQPTLLLLDNLDSLAEQEKVKLREALRRLGSESAAILALRPSSQILEELPSAVPIQLHHGLAVEQAAEYALAQAAQRGIPLTARKAYLIAGAVSGHPLLVERLVAQAGRQDLDELLEDVAKKSGDYAGQIERVYSWCAAGLDPEGRRPGEPCPYFPAAALRRWFCARLPARKARRSCGRQPWPTSTPPGSSGAGMPLWPSMPEATGPSPQRSRRPGRLRSCPPGRVGWGGFLPMSGRRTRGWRAPAPIWSRRRRNVPGRSNRKPKPFWMYWRGGCLRQYRTLTLREMKEIVLRVRAGPASKRRRKREPDCSATSV